MTIEADRDVPVGISLASPLGAPHEFNVAGQAGLDMLARTCDFRSPDPARFRAKLTTAQLGHTAVDSMISTAFTADRTAARIAATPWESIQVAFQISGTGSATQHGRTCASGPGIAVAYHSAHPYKADANAELNHNVQMTVGIEAFTSRWRRLPDVFARPFPDSALTRATRAFVQQISGGLPTPGSAAATFLENAITDLALAMTAEAADIHVAPESLDSGLRIRIRDYAVRNSTDPTLDVDTLAKRFSVSVRTLHRMFQTEDTTAAAFIRDLRLDHPTRLLDEPTNIAIAEIAARAGFTSAASMTRAFRALHGVTPSEYRRDHPARRPQSRRSSQLDADRG